MLRLGLPVEIIG